MSVEPRTAAFELGRQHADLYLGFSCFLLEQSRKSRIEKLNFCTREGVFFKAVFDTLFENGFNGYQIDTGLLEVSRLSTFAPAIAINGAVDFDSLFRLYRKQSPRTLIASLGSDPNEYGELVAQHGLTMDEFCEQPTPGSRLSRLLEDQRFLGRIYPHLARERTLALCYLRQHLDAFSRLGIVDIGWRGTIQNSIAALFPEKDFHGMYLGLALERNVMRPNCRKIAYGPNQNQSSENSDLLHAVNVLEFICLSNSGSAEGYTVNDDGSAKAVMGFNAEEDACVEAFSLPFQEGVLSVARETDIQELSRQHESGTLRIKAMDHWRDLVKRPPASLVKAYFDLKSSEKFGLGLLNHQAVLPTLTTVALSPFVSSRRQRLIRFLIYSQWAEGLRKREDLNWVSKWVFYVLMKLALRYKRATQRIESKYKRSIRHPGEAGDVGKDDSTFPR
jgi:hypothetical protein